MLYCGETVHFIKISMTKGFRRRYCIPSSDTSDDAVQEQANRVTSRDKSIAETENRP
jgi:hypothetical protein